MLELTDKTIRLVNRFFAESDRYEVLELLKSECGNTLPLVFAEELNNGNERIRFAAIKISEGRLDELYYAVDLAQKDWKDLLVFAGFGDDTEAHEAWARELLG